MAHPNLRILRWRKAARIRFTCDADDEVVTDVEELMRGVTDCYDDLTPQNLLVAITPPRDSLYCGDHHTPATYLVQVQLPSTYPLAPARYRMLTPMLHPFVAPLWPLDDLPDLPQDDPCDHQHDQCRSRHKKRKRAEDQDEEAHNRDAEMNKKKREDCADEEHDQKEEKDEDESDDDEADEAEDYWSCLLPVRYRERWGRPTDLMWNADDEADWLYSRSFTEGGRLASVSTHPAEVLEWLVTTMECPSLWAGKMMNQQKCINATPLAHRLLLRHFASDDPAVRSKMHDRTRAMASLVANGMRWRPQMHRVCPRGFRVEVRTLLLVRLRGGLVKTLAMELVWMIIDSLLHLHLIDATPWCT